MTSAHAAEATWITAVAFGFTCARVARATSARDYARAAGTAAALQRAAVYAGHYDTAAFGMRVHAYCMARGGEA
jgi:hypothetical protein